MADEHFSVPKIQRIARVASAFTPGAPIDSLNLFRGRWNQIQDVISAAAQRGYHVALYGERGVGKTSLANVLAEVFALPDLPQFQAGFVTCNTESTFESVWRDVYRELEIEIRVGIAPEDVRFDLGRLETPAMIVIDELDRLTDDDSLTLIADTIKTLSDHVVQSTIVLVGVAQSLDGLIGEHASIVRNLQQVEMPRMSPDELTEILDKGFTACELDATEDAIAKIVRLSEGLPHYTHLLALHAGQRAVQDDRSAITLSDVNAAIAPAIARHSIRSDYVQATRSTRAGTLYEQVLLACALTTKNNLGTFTAGAIREPLRIVSKRRLDIPAFARHLAQFLEPERGSILHREGEPRHYFYRFADPLLERYVVLNGLASGLVTEQQVEMLRHMPVVSHEDEKTPDQPPPSEPQQLF
jgi:Cdc6-like AAA superfamily ATPase